MSLPSKKQVYRVIRERIFITHETPDERKIVTEITLLNESNEEVRSIFLHRDEFMVGLKILDEKDHEIPFLTNEHTRGLILAENEKTPQR